MCVSYVQMLTKQTLLCTATGDHGDMIGCHGIRGKHVPWDESIRVPFLVRLPPSLPSSVAANGRAIPLLIDAPDIMPTLLSLCDLPVPPTVQGRDFSRVITGEQPVDPKMSSLLKVPVPYHLLRTQGITEFRGVRTMQYTYVRNIWGQWLLYDNVNDPYQQNNLLAENVPISTERKQVRRCCCSSADFSTGFLSAINISSEISMWQLVDELEEVLQGWLEKLGDAFEPGAVLLERAGLDHFWEANV